jgi:mRNA-degrading endonuclease toxin of MazEF toxin-antitoxin module
MNQILLGTLVWLTMVLPVFGESMVIPVTPKDMDGLGQFTFAVTNSTVTNGQSFHVIITPKRGSMHTDSKAYLCAAKITGDSRNIGPMTPETQVTLKAGKQTLIADCVASAQLLGNLDACFVFVVSDHRGPSADFYVLKLRDFIER